MRNYLEEAWDMLKVNSKVTLWCGGLTVEPSTKRGNERFRDDADEVINKKKTQEREDEVQEIFWQT